MSSSTAALSEPEPAPAARHAIARYVLYGLVLATMIGGAMTLQRVFERQARNDVAEQLRSTIAAARLSLDRFAQTQASLAIRLATDPLLREAVADLQRLEGDSRLVVLTLRARVLARLQNLVGIDEIKALGVLSDSGTWLATTDQGLTLTPSGLFDREIVHRRLERNLSTVTRPFRSSQVMVNDFGTLEIGRAVMYVIVPLPGVDAALALRYDPRTSISERLARGRFGFTGETYAFDSEAWMLNESRFNDSLLEYGLLPDYESESTLKLRVTDPGANAADPEATLLPHGERQPTRMVRQATTGRPGIDLQGYRDYRGETVLGTWLWLPQMNMGVATEVDRDEAFAPLRQSTRTLWALTGLATLLLAALGAAFERHRRQLAEREARVRAHATALEGRVRELDTLFALSAVLDDDFPDQQSMLQALAEFVARSWPSSGGADCTLRIGDDKGKISGTTSRTIALHSPLLIEKAPAGQITVRYDETDVQGLSTGIGPEPGQRLLDEIAARISGASERVRQVLQLSRQFSELQKVQHSLERAAYYDDLTGLPNRRLFNERLTGALSSSRRHGLITALMFVDLDNFKNVNDTLGHAVGDMLIRQVADRLSETLRESDSVTRRVDEDSVVGTSFDEAMAEHQEDEIARPGGDEYMVMLTGLRHDEDAARVAARFFEHLRAPFDIEGHELFATASIGIALAPRDGDDADTLNKHADAALHLAKRSGKNDFSFYSAALGQQARKRLSVERRLRRAIEHDELSTSFQPVVDARSGHATGVEALVRWTDAELGFVPPNEFIPIAEDCGLVAPLGDLVLEHSCRTLATWHRLGHTDLKVGVNVASQHFAQPEFIAKVRGALERSKLPPSALVLELTERTIMLDAEDMIARLNAVKEMGVRLSVDDFGTGYSSLAYLPRFPLDILKIDIAFVRGLPGDTDSAAITTAIVAMARSLGLKTVAEGVELAPQADFLAAQRVDELQGWLFAKAMTPEECLLWIRDTATRTRSVVAG